VTFGTQGLVQGPTDGHCGSKVITIDASKCKAARDDPNAIDPYPPTMFNGEGDDDQCKYHLRWGVDTVGQNTNVMFGVALTTKVDGAAVRGAPIELEVFLDDTHIAPSSPQKVTETKTPGVYNVGPILFDAPGRWTVRFHIHYECFGRDESPHGHAAFFIDVP
jgi:hypothetical protein